MTTPDPLATPATAFAPPSCPAHGTPPPTDLPRLYGTDSAARPEATYRHLHRQDPASWVTLADGVEAIVVTDYTCALEVLRSPDFTRDARRWKALARGAVPADNEVLPLMAWRPSLLFADGERHRRLRRVVDDALARVDAHALRDVVRRSADELIDRVAGAGVADLGTDYADRLPVLVFTRLFGCRDAWVGDMSAACAAMIDAEPAAAQAGGARLAGLLGLLVADKRARPGQDLTSWMLAHDEGLSDEEMLHQLVVLIGAGTVPTSAWISSTLMVMLTDERFAGALSGGVLTVGDALNDVLWKHSPMANFCFHYAEREYRLRNARGGDFTIPVGVPVLIAIGAANMPPVVQAPTRVHRETNHAHLAFGAGPHMCPAQDLAGVIADAAVETLLDRLPDTRLAVDPRALTWRPGPFHRTLTALPVSFSPPVR